MLNACFYRAGAGFKPVAVLQKAVDSMWVHFYIASDVLYSGDGPLIALNGVICVETRFRVFVSHQIPFGRMILTRLSVENLKTKNFQPLQILHDQP